jgi:signal transduction histidine kinase
MTASADPHFKAGYDGNPRAPWRDVMRHWWSLAPERPGQAWRYWVATGIYNSAFAVVLTLMFVGFNSKATWSQTFFETLLISNCIGFSIHALFEVYFGFRGAWHSRLRRGAQTLLVGAIALCGVFVGYTLAFGVLGRNFPALIARHPRAALALFLIGIVGALIWFLIMDGQTRRLRAEADDLRAREAQAALKRQASEAELRALQAQIEPHFLFNTLAGVQALIDYEPAEAKRMLEAFIEYLRATLDASRRTEATLDDELQLMQRYLALMQVRMGARLSWRVEVAPELRAHRFSPLLMQPLVENAIKYGLEPKIEGGSITLGAQRTAGRVQVWVRDDGLGLNAPSSARKGAGMALKNVQARLQSLFGASARITLADAAPGLLATLEFDETPKDHTP